MGEGGRDGLPGARAERDDIAVSDDALRVAFGAGIDRGAGAAPPAPARVAGRRRHRTTGFEWVLLAALVALGSVLAAGADARFTGLTGIDAAWRAVVVMAMVVAGSHARRWALIVGAAAAATTGVGAAVAAGAVALLGAAVLTVGNRRDRTIGGLVGGLVGLVALGFGGPGGPLRTFVALTGMAAIVWSAHATAPAPVRRRIRGGLLLVLGTAVVLALASLGAVLLVRGPVAAGTRQVEEGVQAAEAGDRVAAAERFDAARASFDAARRRLGGPLLAPVDAVPVLSQNHRAIRGAIDEGATISEVLATEVVALEYDALDRPGGGIDVAVLRDVAGPAHRVATRLQEALGRLDDLGSPLLVGPVAARVDDLRDRLAGYEEEVALAELAAEHGPAVLGAGGSRRYLVLLGNPAESRDLGGHLGTWVELEAVDGEFDLVDTGGPRELALDASAATAGTLEGYPPSVREMDPRRFPQNWGTSPDLPTVARLAAQLFEERTGRAIDGVGYADPQAFAAIVGLTGERDVPGAIPPLRISEANAARFLLTDQYVRLETEQAADRATEALVEAVFDDLVQTRLPTPRELGDRFGPLVRDGRFAFVSLHEEDRALLEVMGVEHRLPSVEGANVLGLVSRNANPSKIDAFLQRDASAWFTWDPPTGEVTGTVEVRLANLAPPGGLAPVILGNALGEPVGTNTTDLALLSRLDLVSVVVDGREVAARTSDEGSHLRHVVRVALPPGGRAVVAFRVRGAVAPGARHRMVLIGQPLVNDGELSVTVTPTTGTIELVGTAVRAEEGDGAARVELSTTDDRSLRWNLE